MIKKKKVKKNETIPVCFLDKGTVLKVINVPKESWNNMEELLLEELEVFKVSPVLMHLFFFSLI